MNDETERWKRFTKAEQRKIIATYGKDSPIVREMRGLPPLREPEFEYRVMADGTQARVKTRKR